MAEEEINNVEIEEEEDEYLPFAKAEVVRLMKQNLDDDKMIRESRNEQVLRRHPQASL